MLAILKAGQVAGGDGFDFTLPGPLGALPGAPGGPPRASSGLLVGRRAEKSSVLERPLFSSRVTTAMGKSPCTRNMK